MVQQTQDPKPSQTELNRQNVEPAWFWFALAAGSLVIHLVLVLVAVPFWQQLSRPEVKTGALVPIDLIDLPPEVSESAPAIQSDPVSAPGTSIPATPPATPSPSQTVPSAPATSAAPETPLPSSSTVQSPSSPTVDQSTQAETAAPTAVNQPDRADATADATENTETATAPGQATPTPSQPTPTEPPGFATIPIDVPTPDVSETLPVSPTPSPSSLAQVEVNRENTPVRLTVHLEFERIDAEKAGDNPERLAVPAAGVVSREISTVDESACAGALKPEIMQSLGVKVSLQVSTDVSGQVTQTAAQAVSRNQSYNELARCLVQHWGFVPAEDEGEPVPSSALLVWVTIDRSS